MVSSLERGARRATSVSVDAVTDMADPFFGEWTANHVELIRSELSSSGSRYTTQASIPLATL
jgi:2'-5' RNA ligase